MPRGSTSRASLLAALVRRQTRAVSFDATVASPQSGGAHALTPVAPSNLSVNLTRPATSFSAQATAWAESSMGQLSAQNVSELARPNTPSGVVTGSQLALTASGQSWSSRVAPKVPALFGVACSSLEVATLAAAIRQARHRQQQLVGDALGIIGGEARGLSLNDTAVNTASAASE